MFSMRIFTINYYLTKPEVDLDHVYSEFRCAEVKQVPVLRIFGSTSDGQKCCLHVHNVFPYLLIKSNKFSAESKELDQYLYDLANQIDKIMNTALCIRDPAHSQHVFNIQPILTKSMYGYHEKDSLFLKIYLYHPDLIRKLSELLINGTVMGESFQAYEAHVPFSLQFLMDFNLFGMNFIYLDSVKFRKENLNHEEIETTSVKSQDLKKLDSVNESSSKWNVLTLDDDLLLPENIERQSTCELELDALAKHILNPTMNKDAFMLNPGLNALWLEEKKRREQLNLPSQLEKPDLEDRSNLLKIENEGEFKQRLISLLETRFDAKYPFKNTHQTNEELKWNVSSIGESDETNEKTILDILEALHNASDEENDSTLLEMNEQEEEIMIDENQQMTQAINLNADEK